MPAFSPRLYNAIMFGPLALAVARASRPSWQLSVQSCAMQACSGSRRSLELGPPSLDGSFLCTPVQCKRARARTLTSELLLYSCTLLDVKSLQWTVPEDCMFGPLAVAGARALVLLFELAIKSSPLQDARNCHWWGHTQVFGSRWGSGLGLCMKAYYGDFFVAGRFAWSYMTACSDFEPC